MSSQFCLSASTENMDSGDEIFLTQNKFMEISSVEDTDVVLNDILDLQAETSTNQRDYPNWNVLATYPMLSILMRLTVLPSNGMKQPFWSRFVKPMSDLERERMAKSRCSSKTDAKSKWAVNLFIDWLNYRNEQYGDREDIRQIKGGFGHFGIRLGIIY
jgi:hypothetical protein